MKCVFIRASALSPPGEVLRMTDEQAASAHAAGLVTYTTKERWKAHGRKYAMIVKGAIVGATHAEVTRSRSEHWP